MVPLFRIIHPDDGDDFRPVFVTSFREVTGKRDTSLMGTQEITLGHLLETYYRESNDRDRGDKFERLVRSYLTTDPTWASQFSDVWLWRDYPDRGSEQTPAWT